MEYQRLGTTDLKVSPLGLGCARIGSVMQAGGDRAATDLIGGALDAGVNFFDTADIYGQGRSEELLAKALRSHSDKVVIATKAGYRLSTLGGIARHVKPLLRFFLKAKPALTKSVQQVRATQNRQDFSAEYLQRRIEASLRRLKREALDLFYLHSPPRELIAGGEVFQTLDKLKTQGKIRHYGVACLTASDALLCLKHPGLAAVQLEVNFLTPEVFQQVLPATHAKRIAVIGRQTLAGGLLLRASGDLLAENCAARTEAFPQIQGRLALLHQIANSVGASAPGLMLRFLRDCPGVCSSLIGTTSLVHLREHLTALAAGPLPPKIAAQVQAALTPHPPDG